MVHDLLCLLGAVALAWSFHLYARVLPTPILLLVWCLFGALIGNGLLYRARIRRRAFLAICVASGSPLQRRLRGGVLLALRPAALGAILALLLMVALARVGDSRIWLGLIAAGPALVLLRAWLLGRLADHVGTLYQPILGWRLAALLVGAVLTVLFTWLAFHQAYPDFTGVSLERAVWHLVDQEQARSVPAEFLLQAAAAKDGVRLWLAQQFMPAPATSLFQGAGWMVIIAEEMLFVWSYLLMSHGLQLGAGKVDRVDP